jgi:hypothetical protein
MLSEIPERTLGWGVLNWCSNWLNQPDGENMGDPWVFTDEQAMFILNFYAVDEYGQYLYLRGVLERPKGWGKSPLLAAICCAELLGPVKFSAWDEDGNPVGRPQPSAQVQIAAISEAQTDNTLQLVGEMLVGKAEVFYGLEIMLSKVTAPNKRSITRVTASPRSREGNRPTFAVLDETHLWIPVERGPELAAVLRRNLAKMNGRSIETTNAPVPGQNSVAENSHDFYEQICSGTAYDDTLLFDTNQVVVEDIYDKAQAFPALRQVYADSAKDNGGHVDLERIWKEINDPDTTENDARRFYFNQRRQDEAQWIKDHEWEKARRDLKLRKSDLIALGFSGVTRNGAAAIVACRIADGALFLVGLWEKPLNLAQNVAWELPVRNVDVKMRTWLEKPQTKYLLCNPWTLQDVVGRWAVDFVDENTDKPCVEEFWWQQPLKQAKAVDQFTEALYSGRIKHAGDPGLTRHVLNAHIEEVTHGYILRKDRPRSARYIAGAQAAVLAYEAAQTAIANGALDDPVDNTVYSF